MIIININLKCVRCVNYCYPNTCFLKKTCTNCELLEETQSLFILKQNLLYYRNRSSHGNYFKSKENLFLAYCKEVKKLLKNDQLKVTHGN